MIMKQKTTAILLATYNGEKFLREQLDSLLQQTYSDWTLYIHDDGSTDSTKEIIKEYEQKYENITMLRYPSQKGAKNNFMSLLERVEANYYLFCDQDDVWRKDKVEKEMARMMVLEKDFPGKPVLVFSDLYVVDINLNITESSMWEKNNICPELLTNFIEGGAFEFVTGCTMLFNKEARNTINFERIEMATMHDAWITLCVLKSEGILSPVHEQLIYYRQHGSNTLGSSDWTEHGVVYKLLNIPTIIKRNYIHWKMLKALEYGSFFKYLKYKYLYRKRFYESE